MRSRTLLNGVIGTFWVPGYLHCAKMKAGEAVHQAVLGAGKWGTSETKNEHDNTFERGDGGGRYGRRRGHGGGDN